MIKLSSTIPRRSPAPIMAAIRSPEILLILCALLRMSLFWYATKAAKATGCLVSDVSVRKEKIVHRAPVIWSVLLRTSAKRFAIWANAPGPWQPTPVPISNPIWHMFCRATVLIARILLAAMAAAGSRMCPIRSIPLTVMRSAIRTPWAHCVQPTGVAPIVSTSEQISLWSILCVLMPAEMAMAIFVRQSPEIMRTV